MRFGRDGLALGRRAGSNALATTAVADNVPYARLYPYYAELCALSEARKKPGFGARFRSGRGGHSLLYLNGVCRDQGAGYPTLRLCESDLQAASSGASISANSHYRNANWVAAEGRDFVFQGLLAPGEKLTRAGYERTQCHAKEMGLLDGVEFHERLFRGKPPGMSKRDYMYEISVATDYAVRFGRDVYRVRVPLDRARMGRLVDCLNGLNELYRDGRKEYRWRLFNDNCSHVAHNALSAAGIWRPWPTGQFFATAAFNFPVPKNEFVDLVLRTNDLPIEDPEAIYEDEIARWLLLEHDTLPTAPGALAAADRAIEDNAVYDIAKLRLIFYDHYLWGRYRDHFARIFNETRYLDHRVGLRYFRARYALALRARRAVRASAATSPERERFYVSYERYIARAAKEVERQLAMLSAPAAAPTEALP